MLGGGVGGGRKCYKNWNENILQRGFNSKSELSEELENVKRDQ